MKNLVPETSAQRTVGLHRIPPHKCRDGGASRARLSHAGFNHAHEQPASEKAALSLRSATEKQPT